LSSAAYKGGNFYFVGSLKTYLGMAALPNPLSHSAGYVMKIPVTDGTLY
jgi:hypothetical protein